MSLRIGSWMFIGLSIFYPLWGAIAQTEKTNSYMFSVLYSPAVGHINNFLLLVSGEVNLKAEDFVGFTNLSAKVDIQQQWQTSGGKLQCDIRMRGGTLRIFSQAGELSQKLGRTKLTFLTNHLGEIIDVRGGNVPFMPDEFNANLDLLATTLASLIIPFPQAGIKPNYGWQATHRIAYIPVLTTVQCVEAFPMSSSLPLMLRLRLRYALPMDLMIDKVKGFNFTARYTVDSEVIFDASKMRTHSASGNIKLEVNSQPIQSTQPPPSNETSNSNPDSEEGESQSDEWSPSQESSSSAKMSSQPSQLPSSSPPSFHLSVDAKFDLVLVNR